MTYLDFDHIDAVDAKAFQTQKPFPFVNPEQLLTDDGYRRLLGSLPDASSFDADFGRVRKFGQEPHDRYTLEYRDGLEIAEPWRELIAELRGERYREFLARMFGQRKFRLRFHWHYAPNGCWVSPHCDSKRKLGSHLFYMNSSDDWDPTWGGQTVALDDGGRIGHDSNPAVEDFEGSVEASCLDNRSFLFQRTARSWHYVKKVQCPEGALRKIFIVVVDDRRLVQRFLSGKRSRNVDSY